MATGSFLTGFFPKTGPSERTDTSYDENLIGDDPELLEKLRQAKTSGIPITDDLIVDYSLTQFPPYDTVEEDWSPKMDHWLNWMEPSARDPEDDLFDHEEEEEEEKHSDIKPDRQSPPPPNDLSFWDEEEQYLWKTKPPKVESPSKKQDSTKSSGSPETSQFRLGSTKLPTKIENASWGNDKQHWMPDDLCRHCYNCEVTFTLIRRRHHCRSCGQVFCNACSSFVLNKHRVCKSCFEHHSNERSANEDVAEASKPTAISPSQSKTMNSAHKETPQEIEVVPAEDPVVVKGHRFTGMCAATHLELLAKNLLKLHAPLLNADEKWVDTLLSMATKCCATVCPNVKRGDLLDIRPYVKIKCIPGGSYNDCAYLSGVMFRKTVTHKRMAKEICNPKLLLVAGGIEFTRSENRIASLETLFEQEDAYTEILIAKMIKIKPDIIMVGKSVSRKAQELLLKAGVVLVQQVKANLLARIARQTGATILTNHVNQIGSNVLGHCRRFRLVTFRDNEAWDAALPEKLLADPKLSNHKRQEALAANKLGEGVVDGAEAIKRGLAKRGVAHTYILLEGCPKHLGCTVVLRGGNQAMLKQVKTVFRFLAGAAYSLLLETTFLKERGVRLDPTFQVVPKHVNSTSLAVDYGNPPEDRRVRPWNGGIEHKTESKELSAIDHQAILITSVWMTDRTQCCPAEVKGICYYSLQDVALGQFLRDSCFNLSLKCQNPNCKKSVLDHSLSFVHNDGLINIMVEEMEHPLEENNSKEEKEAEENGIDDDDADKPIATWSYCRKCDKIVSPLTYISDNTWKFSFGKFLEVNFYNRDSIVNSPLCRCNCQMNSVLYFACGKLAARFSYERIAPFGVFVRKCLPFDYRFHYKEAIAQLDLISSESKLLFANFQQHIDSISLEARSLFNSAMNRPEHLQTVFSELGKIASECDHTGRLLQTKIMSVTNNFVEDDGGAAKTLFRFPLVARRYLYNVASVWNEKLSAAGQAITAMKKIATASASYQDSALASSVPSNINEGLNEELAEGMKRLSKLIDYYQRHNVTDITQVLPSSVLGPRESQTDGEFDEYFDDPDSSIDFSDGVDADVLASRRRLKHTQGGSQQKTEKPTKVLGTRRSVGDASKHESSTIVKSKTPGDAVKSAFSSLFNRGGRNLDRYIVDLGLFSEGRPRLVPGLDGMVVPVVDNQLSSIIAYSLASVEYAKQFRHFKKAIFVDSVSSPDMPNEPPFSQNARQQTSPTTGSEVENDRTVERQMLNRNKSHIKHTFRDFDSKGQITCKFVCTTYWATQFSTVRRCFLSKSSVKAGGSAVDNEIEENYVQSLSSADTWAASGGKSGASFARTSDNRFVIKCISRTELQMFLDCAPAYFEYLSKAFFHGLPTVLCKIVGVYQIGSHNLETGKRSMDQVAVMQNMFYKKNISMIFDLKGSLRGRYAAKKGAGVSDEDSPQDKDSKDAASSGDMNDDNSLLQDVVTTKVSPSKGGPSTLLDGDFLDFTFGRPMPLTDRAKAVFQMSILDTLFLSIINVLDYSILVGIDEENQELVVGIIDFMRQYDILKQMERVGKSLPMVVGREAPTIIQPPLYKARFTNAMERYFMTVPSRWTTI